MSYRPPVVLLSGIRWGFLWQRHQELAVRFAAAGYPAVFVETTGLSSPRASPAVARRLLARLLNSRAPSRAREGLRVYSPIVLPPGLRSLNARLFAPRIAYDLRRLTGERPIVVASLPTSTTLAILDGLHPRLLLYDCSDDYPAFPGAPQGIAEAERELLLRADLVAATSPPLLQKALSIRPDAFLSPPAVDFERFNALARNAGSSEISTVCFFGHLDPGRLDFSVLQRISAAGYTVRLLGDASRTPPRLLRGLDYRGQVPHRALPGALEGVDVFVLPYRPGRLNASVAPAKLFECLATGQPVVSCALPAVEQLEEGVYIARSAAEFVDKLKSLPVTESEELRRERMELARRNSWEVRFADIEERIHSAL